MGGEGASGAQELLSAWSWGASPSWCGCVHQPRSCLSPCYLDLMEVSSHSHDQLTLFLAPLPSPEDEGWDTQFNSSSHGLIFLITSPHPRAHPELPQENKRYSYCSYHLVIYKEFQEPCVRNQGHRPVRVFIIISLGTCWRMHLSWVTRYYTVIRNKTHMKQHGQTFNIILNQKVSALAGVARWIEYQSVNKRAAGLNPSQGTCLGCRPGPQQGVCRRQPHIDVSLFLPSPLSKYKKIFFKKRQLLPLSFPLFSFFFSYLFDITKITYLNQNSQFMTAATQQLP